jgi:hypothetical protein
MKLRIGNAKDDLFLRKRILILGLLSAYDIEARDLRSRG